MGSKSNPEAMVKGRVAETLVEQLFNELDDYQIFKFGMENTVPRFTALLRDSDGKFKSEAEEVFGIISPMPDFLLYHPINGTFFVEVKFRSKGVYELEKKYEKYKPMFIIISKKHIKCISYQELENDESISDKFQPKYTLVERDEFEFTTEQKERILEYNDIARKFYHGF